jgi:hypothetical protein
VAGVFAAWMRLTEDNLRYAQYKGDIAPAVDLAQLNFELNAMLDEANALHLLLNDAEATDRARRGIAERLTTCPGNSHG